MVAVRIADQHLDVVLVHRADHLGQVGGCSGELFLHEEVLAGLGQLDAGLRDLVGRHRDAGEIEVLVGDHVVQARVDARFRVVLLRRVEQARVGLLAVCDNLKLVKVVVHVDEPRLGGADGPHVAVPESNDRYLEGVLIRHVKSPWKAAWTSVPSRPVRTIWKGYRGVKREGFSLDEAHGHESGSRPPAVFLLKAVPFCAILCRSYLAGGTPGR